MKTVRMARRSVVLAGAALLALTVSAPADETWPSRTITLVVPYPAGGSTDGMGRAVGQALSDKFGRVIVENKGGAAGSIGAASVAKAAPDGYTLLLASTGPAATNKLIYKSLPFDPAVDFTPVGMIGIIPQVVIVSPRAPFNTLAEMAAYGKKNPGKLDFANSGVGTMAHIAAVSFARDAGLEVTHVAYRGSAQLITDIMGGQVGVGFPGFIPQVQQMKVLGVTAAERMAQLPNAPTLKESGYNIVAGTWYGVLAPAGTPAPIIGKINAVLNEFVDSPVGKDVLDKLGAQPICGTPEQMATFMAEERARWAPIVIEGKMAVD